jgi:hypothetical protein
VPSRWTRGHLQWCEARKACSSRRKLCLHQQLEARCQARGLCPRARHLHELPTIHQSHCHARLAVKNWPANFLRRAQASPMSASHLISHATADPASGDRGPSRPLRIALHLRPVSMRLRECRVKPYVPASKIFLTRLPYQPVYTATRSAFALAAVSAMEVCL